MKARCKACNESFSPTLHTDLEGRFIRFEEMCNECISLCYQEESYQEIFEHLWVKPVDNFSSYDEN